MFPLLHFISFVDSRKKKKKPIRSDCDNFYDFDTELGLTPFSTTIDTKTRNKFGIKLNTKIEIRENFSFKLGCQMFGKFRFLVDKLVFYGIINSKQSD